MSENLMKSKHRVQKHGEVFTPSWLVEEMLNLEGVNQSCQELKDTFLEPSAGEGVFLSHILKRKLQMVEKSYSESLTRYENYSLYALSTIYGIELLEDNAQMCVINLYEVYKDFYSRVAKKFDQNCKENVNSSAKVIISTNICQGNFLTKLKPDGTPIIFSEWTIVNKMRKDVSVIKVQRTEYSLEDILDSKINQRGSLYEKPNQIGQLDLFEDEDEKDKVPDSMKYVISKIVNVYKEETEYD